MRLLLHFSLVTVASSLSGNVKGTVYMPDLKIEEEQNGKVLELSCATPGYMANNSFTKWGKAWRVNGTESFDASRVTFINDNATLRIQSLHPVDHGVYECCLHAYAYEDYLCFVTKLIFGDENATAGSTEMARNTTEPPMPPAWNVDLVGMDTLNALPNSTYFIRLFDVNVTDVKCLKNGNETNSLKTGNTFPSPLFSDVLIPAFNAPTHQGMYFCNGTYHDGNQTETLHAAFEVIESIDPNLNTQLLDGELVKKYRNGHRGSFIEMWLLVVFVYSLCY